jgi:biotin carboxyl carrier protein
MPVPPPVRLESILEFFRRSSFEYLALETAGQSLQLCREPMQPLAAVRSPSVGVVDLAPGRKRLPRPGEHVDDGAVLFAVRRFQRVVQVRAPADGTIAAVHVDQGTFVQFDQLLADMTTP